MRLRSLFVAAGFALSLAPAHAAGPPAAVVPEVPAVVLQAPRTPAYLLCPPAVTTREACETATAASGAAAVASLSVAAHRPGVRTVVMFVGGYRTSFAHGLDVAHTVAAALGNRFLVVFVDWGSRGKALDYELDAHAAKRNVPAFAALVSDLHRALPDRPLGVFAHSMGARVVAGAMRILKLAPDGSSVVDEAVLAAPDLALDDYLKAITRKPEPFHRVTIYSSAGDHALALSEIVHLHHRLGQVAIWRHTIANTVVVDASAADKIADGHGYAIRDPRVIADIGQVLLDAPVPHPAWQVKSGAVWRLDPNRVSTAP
jgi:esterase/lipase superfamily enzyme